MAAETWTYMGVRVSNGKRVTSWLDEDGRTLIYAEKQTFITGGIYKVEVDRTDGHARRSAPVYVDRLPADSDQRRSYFVAELEAEQHLARLAAERKAKREERDHFSEAMDPLVEYGRACRTHAQRAALIADVIRVLGDSWRL